MNYPTINSFDFLCGYSTGNSKFSHGLETNLEIKWQISIFYTLFKWQKELLWLQLSVFILWNSISIIINYYM